MKRVAKLSMVAFLPILLALTFGCADKVTDSSCVCAQAPAVDSSLMAFLSLARSAHHQADLKEEAGDLPGAIEALDKIISGAVGAVASRFEAREVLADTRARLSDLRGQLGKHDDAEREIVEGLLFAPKDSYFEGHLHEMRGVNEERRAKVLAESGDRTGGEAARKKALESFDRAIDVQDRVIRKELSNAGGDE
jgi:tetratricopeptide (TPR) repeat protein